MGKVLVIAIVIVFCACHTKQEVAPDILLPGLTGRLALQNDSLAKVKIQILKFANLYVNNINTKSYEDSMEYWSRVQKELLDSIAVTRYSIDSLRVIKH